MKSKGLQDKYLIRVVDLVRPRAHIDFGGP